MAKVKYAKNLIIIWQNSTIVVKFTEKNDQGWAKKLYWGIQFCFIIIYKMLTSICLI